MAFNTDKLFDVGSSLGNTALRSLLGDDNGAEENRQKVNQAVQQQTSSPTDWGKIGLYAGIGVGVIVVLWIVSKMFGKKG
jgi:hypothetical protein